jgi:membrane associated rhomboid family serine protease
MKATHGAYAGAGIKSMVFPLYDENPLKWPVPPYATWTLIAVNVAIFLVQTVYLDDAAATAVITAFGTTPAALFHHVPQPGPLPAELTLVTGLFLHASWLHLLGNMIYLWVFGDDIEEALGPARFLGFYFLTGAAAAFAYCVVDTQLMVPLIGASGAIAGVLAAYLLLRPCEKVWAVVWRIVVHVRAYWIIGAWVLLQLIMLAMKPEDGVAYAAHVGGLLAGAVLFYFMRPRGIELFECVEYPDQNAFAAARRKAAGQQTTPSS